MKRAALVLAAVMGIALFGATAARADHRSSGYGRSYGGHSHSHNDGYSRSYGGYGHSGHSHGWSGSGNRSGHYDYHPTEIRFHRGHIHVQPGHYDWHSTRHSHW